MSGAVILTRTLPCARRILAVGVKCGVEVNRKWSGNEHVDTR